MLLPSVTKETGADPRASIVWLHGLGADGNDFAAIVPELVASDWPALRFVFPHAPVRPVTINNGLPMRAWYDIRALSLDERADEVGVRESIAQVDALIAAEGERGIPPERVFVAGFSQGGAMALQAGLRHGNRLAGIVGLSCYLPMAAILEHERHAAGAEVPVLLMHGSHDPVVPMFLGEHARRTLEGWGYAVEWHAYPMQHQVCMEQVADLRRWFAARLAALD